MAKDNRKIAAILAADVSGRQKVREGGRRAALDVACATDAPRPLRLLSSEASFMVRSILADKPAPMVRRTATHRWPGRPLPHGTFATPGRWAWSAPSARGVARQFRWRQQRRIHRRADRSAAVFQIVDALRETQRRLPDTPLLQPVGVAQVDVCAASDYPPNADCPCRALAWYIRGRSPIRISSVHRRLAVNTRTGLQACADTPAQLNHSEAHEFWPSDILRLFARAGMPRRRVRDDHCASHRASASIVAPKIVSPVTGATYQLRARTLRPMRCN